MILPENEKVALGFNTDEDTEGYNRSLKFGFLNKGLEHSGCMILCQSPKQINSISKKSELAPSPPALQSVQQL